MWTWNDLTISNWGVWHITRRKRETRDRDIKCVVSNWVHFISICVSLCFILRRLLPRNGNSNHWLVLFNYKNYIHSFLSTGIEWRPPCLGRIHSWWASMSRRVLFYLSHRIARIPSMQWWLKVRLRCEQPVTHINLMCRRHTRRLDFNRSADVTQKERGRKAVVNVNTGLCILGK